MIMNLQVCRSMMTEGKESTEDSIHYLCKLNALMAEKLYELIIKHELQNSQECLNWLDKLNEISVRS